MDFAAGLHVFVHVFGHQMAAVGGGIDQNIVGAARQAAVQRGFQGFVAVFAFFERQIVAKHDEFFGARFQQHQEHGQGGQIVFVHFNQAQALFGVFVQQCFDQR